MVVREAVTNAEKGALLFEAFFPNKPVESAVPENPAYPPPRWAHSDITDAQIHRALKKMKPYKATSRGTPPNSVMIYNGDLLVPHLAPLFRATSTLHHYPAAWAVKDVDSFW
ncbi:hypothetical protein HYPSUDRAFT_145421 [Hypholoma sublateritium FD-334 SS-4]|uniref:Uncharacterized protein n=1 Tax=Hypholoma sublateritium (strain FD-334 SS-4) TaxID=945553 RepID=A0A0D2M4S7_HYPSF|nr:hypothetical protein HYPSUDRAFT_145421 [Hypholoma sublateritium FD-334 SS-4]